jgi:para-aminobenzoate synthetase component 1
MVFFNLGPRQILSASPEILLEIDDNRVRSFPIKGTRPRGSDAASDAQLREELLASEKDAAELLMIVDLVRNDLGKFCELGSVRVSSLKQLETLPQVHHLVGCVEGRCQEGVSPLQALRELSPGGSITGTPKRKAMEIIQNLEVHQRGIYTGSLGYWSFNNRACFNIAIRTAVLSEDKLEYFAGGGIVADSDPELEYEETLVKTRGLLEALK